MEGNQGKWETRREGESRMRKSLCEKLLLVILAHRKCRKPVQEKEQGMRKTRNAFGRKADYITSHFSAYEWK
jgi:hypothetical protein